MTGTSSSLSLLRKTRTDGRFDLPAAGVDKRISLLAVVPSTWRITGVTIWIAENRGCRVCAMPELPTGTVTFLFTDVQGSTRLWEQAPSQMMEALAQHDDVVERTVADHNGHIVKPRGEGDSRFVVFPNAADAVVAAVEIQRGLDDVAWATPSPIIVRIALHTGVAELESGDYYGAAVNRAARLRGIAHGGQVLLSRTTWDLVRDGLPDGLSTSDMGRHKLRDLTRPDHVYQVEADGLATSFPPLISLDEVPNNLPEQLTEFVGRDGELADVQQLLASSRLVTLLGPGGAGKSRLALQTAAEVSSQYRHGVFLVSLAPIDEFEEIVPTIAESVGVPLSSEEGLEAQLLNYLKSKCQLLILDNFEHLQHGASIVSEVLQKAPEVSLLVTSRARLKLSGESVLVLDGLDYRWSTPDEAVQCEGVKLFADAAQRRLAGFALSESNLDDVGRILAAVQGMPLGILLAAAWVDVMPVGEIADEIGKSLDLLEAEVGDMPDRHQSIQAVFEYSWRLLAEKEQRLFSRLGVFRGGFGRAAAKDVAGASVRDLSNLVSKSLLTADPESGRYTVHELLRQ